MSEHLLVKNKRFKSMNELFYLQKNIHVISGPCSVESYEQMSAVASCLKKNNLHFLRGGAYKPRTSPYSFQGLEKEGLKILGYIKKEFGLKIVTEILDPRDIYEVSQCADVLQVGSKNMSNVSLLKELGKSNIPILLKRGYMATLREFYLAAEYIVTSGNDKLILCERGIRTLEDSTRNTLDISSIALIKKETTLPVFADISHSLGRSDIATPVAQSLVALGVDGIMVEVHPQPAKALSDAEQQLTINEFQTLYDTIS